MKTKKLLCLVLTALMSLSILSGCEKKAAPADIGVGVLKGPTAIGMVRLMEQNESEKAANNYAFTVAGTADELSAALIKGDLQFAAVPCNLASVLYNKTEGKIKMLAINTLGVLYIVEAGNSVQTLSDLKGKTIYSTGKGTTPEFTLRYLLKSAGIDPDKDVTIEYKSEATEIASLLSGASEGIAMLPQPYVTTVTMNNSNIRIALNVTEEWEKLNSGSTVVTGVIVGNSDFIDKNPDAVKSFLDEYRASTEYANTHIDETAALVEYFNIFKAAVAKKAIPYCNIVCITGSDMKTKAGAYLKVLFDGQPSSVGGTLPDENLYFLQK